MKRLIATAMTLMISAAFGTAAASAHDYGYRYEEGAYGRGYYDYARVVNVDPIVEIVSQPVRSQRCEGSSNSGYGYNSGYGGYNGYDNDSYGNGNGYDNGYNRYNYGYNTGGTRYGNSGLNGGKLLGALVGGALGNTIGKGDGRKATTIGGAVLGYAIAGQVQRDNRYDRSYGYNDGYNGGGYNNGYGYGDSGYYNSPRCQIVTEYRRDRRVVGYDVTYDYQGRIQHVRSATDPGNSIRVRVDVRPGV
jgi:uncharacterized protein YcfJ